MPQPHLRVRSIRRVEVPVPGGRRRKPHYKKKSASKPLCAHCKGSLNGIPAVSAGRTGKLNRSRKRIQRPYGGTICHSCLKKALKEAVREGRSL